MIIAIRDLEVRKVHFDLTFPPGEIEFDKRLSQVSPLRAEGSAELLNNTLGEIRVRGKLNVRMEAECDRCLETASFPLDVPFDLFYRPADTGPSSSEVNIDEGESEIAFFEGEGLDLRDVFREHVLLSLPMQKVCSTACRGICPVCGQNRNQSGCACETKPVDDRWSALRSLAGPQKN